MNSRLIIPAVTLAGRFRGLTHAFRTLCWTALAAGMLCQADAQSRPTISKFTPAKAPTTALVTITGTNFDRDINGNVWTGTPPYTVQFGGSRDVTPTFISSTQLRVAVPNNATNGPVRLRAFGGGQVVISQSTKNFTLKQVTRPAITSFSPASAAPGTEITITGTNFQRSSLGTRWSGSPPYRVQFFNGSQPLEAVPTFVSNTQIRVVVPNNASAGQSPLRLRQNGVVFNTSGTAFTVTRTSTPNPTTPTTPTPPPATGTILRLVNNTQYNIVSLTLNGSEQFTPGSGVLSGSTVNLATTAGSKSLVAGLGFVNADGSRDIWFTFTRSINVTSGQTNTQTFSRITVGQLLTMGAASTTWNGTFFDDNGAPHLARFVFSSNGSWQFFIDGVLSGSGTLTEVSWPNSSPTVTFRINSTLPAITISHPFGSFLFRNGPPSFPIIQSVKQ
jgi:uncharacterized protein (TIGR03437 family)